MYSQIFRRYCHFRKLGPSFRPTNVSKLSAAGAWFVPLTPDKALCPKPTPSYTLVSCCVLAMAPTTTDSCLSFQHASPFNIRQNPLRRYRDFSIFQDGVRPPSCICLGHIWTIHEEYLVIFNTMQNLFAIDKVVLYKSCNV